MHNNFKQTAEEMNIPFQIVHKKVNLSEPTIYWEHEQFSRKKNRNSWCYVIESVTFITFN